MGRLAVFVPEFGGDPEDQNAWIICSYASPFAGATPVKFVSKDLQSYSESQTSYGWWSIPPDVDTKVLVAFASGSASRGFWFSCVYDHYMNQMVPGYAASESEQHYGPETTTDKTPLPTSEYNKMNTANRAKSKVIPNEEKKPVHPYVSQGLKTQGLVYDEIRGTSTSSARREAPSKVFGINTPGPLVPQSEGGRADKVYTADRRTATNNEGNKIGETLPITRKGGHQFVMDDHEDHEFIKLKTRSGSEIMLDETNGIVYITNRDGTAWIELSESGHVDVYAKNSLSVRSEKDINFRADRDFNLEAGRNINIKAAKDYVDDTYQFMYGYTNRDGKNIQDIISSADKKQLIADVNATSPGYIPTSLSASGQFEKAMEYFGMPTNGSKDYQTGDYTVYGSLPSAQLLQIIRGSHLVGEGLGDGGHITIQAKGDMHSNAAQHSRITAESGNLDLFSGLRTKMTSGTSVEQLIGTAYTLTAGTTMDITSGSTTRHTIGGDYNFTVINETKEVFRGDTSILFEGYNLNIEAQPVKYSDTAREVDDDTQHQTIINLERLDLSGEKIYVTGKFRDTTPGEIHVKSTGEMFIDATLGMNLNSSTSIILSAPIIQEIAAPAAPATEADENNFYLSFPNSVPYPERANPAEIADLAHIPAVYSKLNVLPTFVANGNKVYDLAYYTQVVETISRRFMTHEPCVEHENTGKVEEKDTTFSDNLKYRIVDGN
jgi:hypothetical protein